MRSSSILIIEDDPALLRGLKDNFEAQGCRVQTARDGPAGLAAALANSPDLVILDIMLPKMNGYEICRAIRAKHLEMPIIMLTAKGQEEDIIRGLELGADDYVTKPFSIRELLARARAFLRRRETSTMFEFGECKLDLAAHKLFRNGKEIALTAKEFRLLEFLAGRPGRALTRDQILDAVWGNEIIVNDRSVDRCVTTLRAKIENDPHRPTLIRTIRDIGYRFGLWFLALSLSAAQPLRSPGAGKPGFTPMSSIAFTNVLADERGLTNQIYMSGSGVAAGDVDGDGWCDLYFCAVDSPNRLFRNLGDWRFTEGPSIAMGASTGAVFADVDGDSDLDLLVSALSRGVRLFLNVGQGHFRDATDEHGLRRPSAAMTMALADIEGDGDLDLYVANFRDSTLQDEVGIPFRMAITNGEVVIRSINNRPPTAEELTRYTVHAGKTIIENGEMDVLYRNDGRGRFAPVSWTDGTFLDEHGKPLATPPYDWSYTAMFHDMNGDSAPDLYICSDNVSPDRIWINDGRGRFRALSTMALRHTSLASMGVDFADINRDGFDDIFVADMLAREHGLRHRLMVARRSMAQPGVLDYRMQYMRNTLFLNRGDGTYAEIAHLSGVDASDWSWSPVFLDVDLDGYEDLLITTGLERSLRDADARRQIDARRAKGNLSTREFLELRRIMPRLETPNYAFRNRGDLTFENVSDAWGFNSRQVSQGMALADLDNDGDMDVAVNVLNGASLLYRNNCAQPRIAVRLKGKAPNTQGIGAKIKVIGGPVTQTQEMISGGRYLSGDDAARMFAAGTRLEVTWRNGTESVIEDVKANHVYEIDETTARPKLQAPGSKLQGLFEDVSWMLDHVHEQQAFNDFERQPLLPRQLSRMGPAVRWTDLNKDGWDDLVVGSMSFINTSGKAFIRTNAPSEGPTEGLVGGREVPGRYPEFTPARLLRAGEVVTTFTNLGLVNGTVFADMNKDGLSELVVACDWGPIKVFRNEKGKFVSWDLSPFAQITGWWNCVATGDFNNDGRLDLVAGNWGGNTTHSRHIFYGDLDGDGTVEIIEADDVDGNLKPKRPLDALARAMPWLGEKYPTYAAFSEADINGVLGEARGKAKHLSVNTVESMVFLNQGDRFEARALPMEAQFSPVFALSVGDFDNDGNEDLFLAQNFFGTDLESSCHDAGRGLCLRGDGRGNFSPFVASGIAVYGEQRGCAVSDFDRDGRLDLAVSQNGAATKLFRNQSAPPGVRIKGAVPAQP